MLVSMTTRQRREDAKRNCQLLWWIFCAIFMNRQMTNDTSWLAASLSELSKLIMTSGSLRRPTTVAASTWFFTSHQHSSTSLKKLKNCSRKLLKMFISPINSKKRELNYISSLHGFLLGDINLPVRETHHIAEVVVSYRNLLQWIPCENVCIDTENCFVKLKLNFSIFITCETLWPICRWLHLSSRRFPALHYLPLQLHLQQSPNIPED